jgi:iron complex transport system substrate-binding protein
VKIVSLLPSATEIVYALGRGDDLVGVTFECDYPADARTKRIVSTSALPEGLTPSEIDRVVTERIAAGEDLYRLDADALRDIDADVILTQDLCAVCAVDITIVDDALAYLGCNAEVVTLDPRSIEEVLGTVEQVGDVLGEGDQAASIVEDARERLLRLRNNLALELPRPVLMLEWTDPPFSAGHWVPDLARLGGGDALLANPGGDSVRLAWDTVESCHAEVVVVAPCGFHLDAASQIAEATLAHGALPPSAEVWAVDADAYFVRPGPRVVAGAEVMSRILHPTVCGAPDPSIATRIA